MLSPVPFAILSIAYGVFYLLFAFVEPPPVASRLFKIPSFFVFFPDRYQVAAGRVFSGVLLIVAPFIVAFKLLFWRP